MLANSQSSRTNPGENSEEERRGEKKIRREENGSLDEDEIEENGNSRLTFSKSLSRSSSDFLEVPPSIPTLFFEPRRGWEEEEVPPRFEILKKLEGGSSWEVFFCRKGEKLKKFKNSKNVEILATEKQKNLKILKKNSIFSLSSSSSCEYSEEGGRRVSELFELNRELKILEKIKKVGGGSYFVSLEVIYLEKEGEERKTYSGNIFLVFPYGGENVLEWESDGYKIPKILKKYFKKLKSVISGSGEKVEVEGELYSENSAEIILKKLLRGVQFLHSHGILHKDIKPENILINPYNPTLSVKIIDFSISTAPYPLHLPPLPPFLPVFDSRGTEWFLPPETFSRPIHISPGVSCCQGEKVDVWGVGVVGVCMVKGRPLWKGESREEQIEILSNLQPSDVESKVEDFQSENLKSLLKCLLSIDPHTRCAPLL